jgi:O-antigen/teichoic acid export membrane protein
MIDQTRLPGPTRGQRRRSRRGSVEKHDTNAIKATPETGALHNIPPLDAMITPLSNISRATLTFGLARLLSQGLMFAALVILARVTDPAAFGVVSFVLAMSVMLFTFSDFGMSSTVQSYVVELGPGAVRPAFAVKVASCVAVAACVYASDEAWGAFKGEGTWIALIVIASSGQFAIMTSNATGHFARAGMLQLLSSGAFLIGGAALAVAWDPIAGPLFARAFSFAIIGLGLLRLLVFGGAPLRLKGFRGALRMGAIVTVNGVFTQILMRSDLALVAYLDGFEATGIYRAAHTLATVPLLIQALFQFPLMRIAAGLLKNGQRDELRRVHRSITRVLVLALCPILAGGWALASPLLALTFGPEYTGGDWILRLLLLAASAALLAGPVGAVAYMDGRTKAMAKITAICSIPMIGLAIVLIPFLGSLGVALAACVAQCLWASALLIHHHRAMGCLDLGLGTWRFTLLVVLLVSLVIAAIPLSTTALGLVPSLLAILAIYVCGLWKLGFLTRQAWEGAPFGLRE